MVLLCKKCNFLKINIFIVFLFFFFFFLSLSFFFFFFWLLWSSETIAYSQGYNILHHNFFQVREKLIAKQLSLERSEKAKKLRELRKFGKKVQHEVTLQRHKEKRQLMESVKQFKKGRLSIPLLLNFTIFGCHFEEKNNNLVSVPCISSEVRHSCLNSASSKKKKNFLSCKI